MAEKLVLEIRLKGDKVRVRGPVENQELCNKMLWEASEILNDFWSKQKSARVN